MTLRLLANENIPKLTVEALQQAGHDVLWAGSDMAGAPDPEILARAQEKERIVLTFDKDFGELAFRRGLPAVSGIILLRFTTESPGQVSETILKALGQRTDWAGHFSVVEGDRIRMTPLAR